MYRQNTPIPLIKLNGSLDWGICQSCERLHLYFPHMHSDFYGRERCQYCKRGVDPFVIIPHEEGEMDIRSELQAKAKKALAEAEKITIIGYSFPSYDVDVINIFKESLKTNSGVKIEVIDYFSPDTKISAAPEERKKQIAKNKIHVSACSSVG